MTEDEWQAHVTREAGREIGGWLEARGRLDRPIRSLTLRDLEAMADNAISRFIVLAAHAALLETGFLPLAANPNELLACQSTASTCKFAYQLKIDSAELLLSCSSLGGGTILLAVSSTHRVKHLLLQTAKFFPSSVTGDQLQLIASSILQLWTLVKEALAFPMLLAVYAEAGLPPPAGLLALPVDVTLAIFSHLGVRVAATAAAAAGDSQPRQLFD